VQTSHGSPARLRYSEEIVSPSPAKTASLTPSGSAYPNASSDGYRDLASILAESPGGSASTLGVDDGLMLAQLLRLRRFAEFLEIARRGENDAAKTQMNFSPSPW
jgi:hypothetical protein